MYEGMKFSVIVPVYNVESYIEKCLDSLVNQTLKEIEIICINDGSTDRSLEILEKFAQKDSRIKVISQENQGQGVARNNGIKVSRGEYIAFVDPDDWIENNALELAYNMAKENNAEVVHFNYAEYNDYSKKIKKRSFEKITKKYYGYNIKKNPEYNWHMFKKGCLSNLTHMVWNKVYSREFILKNDIKFPPNKHGEDIVFTQQMLLSASKIYYLDEYLYYYRCRANSAVNSLSDENFCVFDNIKFLREYLLKQGLYFELEKEFNDYKVGALNLYYNYVELSSRELYKEMSRAITTEKEYKKFIKRTKSNDSFFEKIFSIKNKKENGRKHKVLTLCGIKFVFKSKVRAV